MSVIIVTGGTFGLGQAITVELAQRGHQVLSFGLSQVQVSSTAQGFESLQQALAKANAQAEILEADVSNTADVQRVIEKALAKFGRIDGLVNNAAIGPLGTVLNTEEALFERIFDVNVKGCFLMSRAVIPYMREVGGGAIVNIGSGAGYGKANMAAYSASKAAIVGLSMAMAYDHFHDRIRVNVAIPGGGGIVSGMSVGRMGGDAGAFTRKATSGLAAGTVPGTVAGRFMEGQDLARAVAFLLSEDAAAISGTVLDVGCFAHQGGPVPVKPTPA